MKILGPGRGPCGFRRKHRQAAAPGQPGYFGYLVTAPLLPWAGIRRTARQPHEKQGFSVVRVAPSGHTPILKPPLS